MGRNKASTGVGRTGGEDIVDILNKAIRGYLNGKLVFESRPRESEGVSPEDMWGEFSAIQRPSGKRVSALLGTAKRPMSSQWSGQWESSGSRGRRVFARLDHREPHRSLLGPWLVALLSFLKICIL